jgi:RNA recognition motif-containing protein
MNFVSQVESLVISDLPLECKEPDLLVLAQTYGRVKSCEIKRDFRNHVISVYGIISYFNLESAENAFRALHGARYMGKTLRSVSS